MTVTCRYEGDFPGTLTRSARHGSGSRERPSPRGQRPSQQRLQARLPRRAGTAAESAQCAGRSR